VPANKLLVYSVTEGWEPLCKFLGVPVPPTPFPRKNERAQMQKLLCRMYYAVRVGPGIAAAVLVVLIAAVLHRVVPRALLASKTVV
jgi:Sulfotransferase domain